MAREQVKNCVLKRFVSQQNAQVFALLNGLIRSSNMPFKTIACFLALTLGAATHAETIKLKLGEQGKQEQVELPLRGMSMEEVETQFGKPETKTKPRGEPPISAWHYANFAVYFESRHVLHSVIKHQPAKQK
ncbi:hypothetical protein A3758_09585 [Oleiphilus sp. HI0118]|nr:hypothetical protein A3750_04380 [Oleiphilus sp. HI0079]KZZ40119.1 hypothetical protein A3758_09585 [Oleiphilus sp. HI0118]